VDAADTPQDAEFRAGFRDFLRMHRDALVIGLRWPETDDDVVAHRRHQRTLYEGGYAGITWPTAYGGRGGTVMQEAVVEQESTRAGLPRLINLVAIGMCGPTLMACGNDEQRSRYLPGMLTADELWCQLFSEPGAGSDLAAVSTFAARDGEGWRVSGQKVWTSGAQYADFGLLLARTNRDLPRHRGLTMFVIDMKAPGLTVRPLRQMSGDSEFNEVFLDNVRVEDENRVGEVHAGWGVALTTLASERMLIGGTGTDHLGSFDELIATVARQIDSLHPATAAGVRQDLAKCWIENQANKAWGYRRLTGLARGETPGAEASAGKLTSTRLARSVADLGMRVQSGQSGPVVPEGAPDWRYAATFAVALSIAGGTDEVVKNILGERVLGLPAEPRPA
jgi:alkylation response protein AidB-like acyl-CoA dehydrogenase